MNADGSDADGSPEPYTGPPSYGPPPGDPSQAPPLGYGPPPGYGPPLGYGPPPGYGPPLGYGPPPGYAPPYGYAPGFPGMAPSWPAGPGRPGVATAAAVLGFVTAGLTALMTAGFLFALADGDDEAPYVLTILTGLLCAAGLLVGGIRLLSRRSADLLFFTALAAIGSLALVAVVASATLYGEDADFFVVFAFLGAPLPAVTAVLARHGRTVGWASSGP